MISYSCSLWLEQIKISWVYNIMYHFIWNLVLPPATISTDEIWRNASSLANQSCCRKTHQESRKSAPCWDGYIIWALWLTRLSPTPLWIILPDSASQENREGIVPVRRFRCTSIQKDKILNTTVCSLNSQVLVTWTAPPLGSSMGNAENLYLDIVEELEVCTNFLLNRCWK